MTMPWPVRLAVVTSAVAVIAGAVLVALGNGPALILDLANSVIAFCM
ncbi:MAG: hypothetical protein AAFR55_00185 [Pseudomonadota bacterium]